MQIFQWDFTIYTIWHDKWPIKMFNQHNTSFGHMCSLQFTDRMDFHVFIQSRKLFILILIIYLSFILQMPTLNLWTIFIMPGKKMMLRSHHFHFHKSIDANVTLNTFLEFFFVPNVSQQLKCVFFVSHIIWKSFPIFQPYFFLS